MHGIDDLLLLMRRLRDPQTGCPWDLEQSIASLVPHTLEEAYEVADAAAQGDLGQLRGELGDLLFQVVFYAQLASEQGSFDWSAVVDGIVSKLLRRHPHVFPDGQLHGNPASPGLQSAQVAERWEQIKAEERAGQAQAPEQLSLLDDVPLALPALSRAQKLQKRAASAGFDWPELAPVLDKLDEELAELREALAANQPERMAAELGDLLFTVVNLARHLQVNAEAALRGCNQRFEQRFRYIESRLRETATRVEDSTAAQLDALWNQAKVEGL